MDKKDLRIVYMGTPDFAVESLKRLVEGGYNVVGVITMPDKPSGRGQKLTYSAVKEYALSAELNILQPEKLKDETFIKELANLKADLQIVVAFRMLPEVVWNMPPKGTFNLHASLLPQYRGAAPINRAIMNGDKVTGATTFFLTHEIDTGEVIMQRELAIGDNESAGSVHDRLMTMGGDLVIDTVDAIIADNVTPIPQEDICNSNLRNAPKIFKDDCKIDWSLDCATIKNHIRGLSPYPAAWCMLCNDSEKPAVSVKIFEVEIDSDCTTDAPIGAIKSDNNRYLKVKCADGWISINMMQLPGKKRLGIVELLRGYKLTDGATLS